ncbi:MAG: FAD-binding oxidoreductase [Syntrophales bacterium]|jgi:ferredoxin-NADP reductase|nr:FAD-binding oxidoreductase [Syntrophales bacterium]MCK9527939.1 FAD-binding oxidoreductase [Syntrophales bacterium]MDX9921886.1 FAD-binding oxidoreductase [Syntrophales bacterium]
MNDELAPQMDCYEEVLKEIELSRRFGSDYSLERGEVARYINALHPPRMTLRVREIIQETSSTATFRLIPADGQLPPFLAGQYVTLFLTIGKIRTARPYSISSPPNQTAWYDVTIRRVEEGLVSNHLLDTIQIGDLIETSGPVGTFYYNPIIHRPVVAFIAGGSGITPFMSMIREIYDRGLDRRVFLFYGNRDSTDIIFGEEIERIAAVSANIHYVPVIENPDEQYDGRRGFITGSVVKEEMKTLHDATFFICGPQGMYDFCLPELEAMGIPRRSVRREMSGPPLQVWEQPGWPEEVKKDAVFSLSVGGVKTATIRAPATESILTTLEKNGIPVPSLCRSGECSLCRLKLLSGTVFQPRGTPIRKSDRQFGYIHSCAAYPLEDCAVLI